MINKKIIINLLFYTFLFSFIFCSCEEENEGSDNPPVINKPPVTDSDEEVDINFSFDYRGKDTRSLLKCDSYTQSQKDSLNRALTEAISKAKSRRAKVVTAATFLVSLDYAIPYGHEWIVADDPSFEFVGRYTKKGLHLTEFTDDKGTVHKPWGCLINTHPRYPRETIKNLGDYYENGLHCSSFVGWCLLNGSAVTSVDLLDKTYANDYRIFPTTTEVSLKTGADLIRPGDLLWFQGHIAIVIGVKGDIVIYASAEGGSVYPGKGVSWLTFNKKTTNFDTFMYKSFIQMNKVYFD